MEENGKLERQILELFATRFHAEAAELEGDLLDTGLVDSVRLVELVLELELRYGISLPFEELEIDDFRTVKRIAGLVGERRAGSPRPESPA